MAPKTVLPRIYDAILASHLAKYRQMAFLAGPRQVGKTTTSRRFASARGYLSWDDPDQRRVLLRGPLAIAAAIGADQLSDEVPVAVFDELHKFARWKSLLKG